MNNQPQNSLQGIESGKITKRLLYVLYLIIGILFFVIALLTAYNILAVATLHVNDTGVFRTALFLCYVFLSLMTASGFLFCRKWLIPVLGVQMVLLFGSYIYALSIGADSLAQSRVPGLTVFFVLFVLTLFTKDALYGPAFKKLPVLSFILILLLSFFITNFNLIY